MVQEQNLSPPLNHQTTPMDDEEATLLQTKNRRRKFIKCCAFTAATLLILAIVIVTLIFTVFRVKDPIISMNNVTITQLQLINNTVPKPGTNMSLIADISVKNPNYASFRYGNTTTGIFYHESLVGEARGPPGRAKARRTMRMNISVDIIMDRVTSNPNLGADLGSGLLTMNSYSRVPGRVKMLGIVRKHVTVKMNCTISVNISSMEIQSQKCKRKVDL